MSARRRIPLALAARIAREVSAELALVVERSEVVGSVRRRRPTVGDIEILVEPRSISDLFGDGVPDVEAVRRVAGELGNLRSSERASRQLIVDDVLGNRGVRLEIYLAHEPATWGALLAIRTGPANLGKYVVTVCRRRGIVARDGRAIELATGKPVPTETEEAYLAIAGVECLPPHLRDAQAIALWNDLDRYSERGATP